MVDIRDKQVLLSSDDGARQLQGVLDQLKEEMDDHRLAINENTSEITATNEFLNELAVRLDKMQAQLDELTMLVKGKAAQKEFQVKPLSNREKEVFLVLYSLGEGQNYVTYDQIVRKTGLPKDLVQNDVTSMILKGVPVLKKFQGNHALLKLDEAFRQKQAKENIVGVNTLLSYFDPQVRPS